MYCTRCGAALEAQHRYCWQCGVPTGVDGVKTARLVRPMAEKQIAGVCAGFARYLDMDVTLTRIIWLLVAIFTGIGFIAYIIGWIAMPADYGYRTPAAPVQNPTTSP
jgi:phage shock protein C